MRLIVLSFLCLALVITSSSAFSADPSPIKGVNVVAKVGDREITVEMLNNIINTIPEENRVPFLTPDGRKKILDEVIAFMLFSEGAKAAGIDKEAAVKTRLDYTQTEFLAMEFLRRRLAQAPQVSDDDVKAYYEAHKNELRPPEEIKARHIVIKTEAEANKVLDEFKAGAKFDDSARKYSIDPAAPQGGRLTLIDGREWIPRGTFEQSFEHILFKLPVGQPGGPHKTQFGWHILLVEEKRQPGVPSLSEARGFLRNRLKQERMNKMRNDLLEEQKKKVPVEMK
ncbi:MAG: peptidyl-prolyl cis-trans isomerase [Pseudomonadota bacterium]